MSKVRSNAFAAVLLLSILACSDAPRPLEPDAAGNALVVRVTDGDAPLGDILVRITAVNPTSADSARTDATGVARFSNLREGSWDVRVDPPSSHDIAPADSVIRVQVRADSSEQLSVVLLPLPTEGRGEIILTADGIVLLPCGSAEQWLVRGDSSIIRAYHESRSAGSTQIFAELRGQPSHLGGYGAFGVYDRELPLAGVTELRAMRASDCAQPGLNAAPHTLVLGVGESAPVQLHWIDNGRTPAAQVTWSSSDETVAGVDAGGTATATGIGTALITAHNGADTVAVVVRVPPSWYLEGYGTLEGVVTDADGSPASGVLVTASCPITAAPAISDAAGRYSIRYHFPEGGGFTSTGAAMSDARTMACHVQTERTDGIQGVSVGELRFGTLATPLAPSKIDVMRKPRGLPLQIQPARFSLRIGSAQRLTILENGAPTENVDLRVSQPAIAGVNGDRIFHRTNGSVVIIATSRADTTSIGLASAVMLR